MLDNSEKNIEDVKIGDATVGGRVTAVMVFDGYNSTLYDYMGVKVSGSHAVYEDGVWKRVCEARNGRKLGDHAPTLYCFCCEKHRIVIGDVLFADYEETEPGKVIDVYHRMSLAQLNQAITSAVHVV